MGAGRRPWPGRHGQSVRAVLHHEGGRLRDRARAVAANRRGARRLPDARQPRARQGLRGPPVAADRRPRVSRAFVLAGTLALGACRVEPDLVLAPSVDAGPDLRTRPRTSAALTFRVTGRPDTAAAWPYTISWGDGTTDQGTLTDPAPAHATHAFAAAGRYTVRVTVTPRAGATLVDTLTAVVEAPATPQIFVGAGDIASCATAHAGATAQLLDGIPGTVFALGDDARQRYGNATVVAGVVRRWGRRRLVGARA